MTTPCNRCQSPLEPDDLRCAICGLPTPSGTKNDATHAVAQIFRCQGCGAAIAYDAAVGAPRCDFCKAVMALETPADPVEQAEHFLAFRVDEATARTALRQWLAGRGFFRPSDLASASAVDALRPLWWVGWVFDADVTVSWAADSNAGNRRSSWAPHAGQAGISLRRVIVPASRGLSIAECSALIPAYNLADATPTPQGPGGATIEQFDAQRSTARKLISDALRSVANASIRDQIPGSTHRNVHVAVLPKRLHTTRSALPAWVLAYRYRDKLYRAIVHGQDPSRVVGDAPVAVAKVVATIVGVLALIAVVVLILSR